ncbi:N-acetylmuramoyl-L-alanine amidase [Streptomyces sp. NPDC006798]|uniref:N-acetylmuramoyl-L-alanine amidase n=1 Tax=Streptomyces sp. NPDC006798 TaxID=3155462 RepID=UPI0034111A2F
MATPMTAAQFEAALRAEGVEVAEVGDWQNHTRTGAGRPWGPVNGVVIHHTVTKRPADPVRICRDGYSGLPGPLCHAVITKDGTVHLIGWGRTNHAGGGDPAVLAAVTAESYGSRPPAPTKGNADGIDGNRHFYGFECENLGDGKDPWPAAQLDAIERAATALCRIHGWSAKSVIGHLEWSDDKSDPRGFTMPDLRERVAARLAERPAPNPDPKPKPKPPTPPTAPVVDLSKIVAAARRDPSRPGAPVSYPGVKIVEQALVKEGLLTASLADGHYGTATKKAYAAWQRGLGYSGTDADGIPGQRSLRALGTKRGFTVTP